MSTQEIWRANGTMFYNSQSLFIEFHDVIQSPWYYMFLVILSHPKMQEVFNLVPFEGMTPDELYEWYVHRKYRNLFLNFSYIGPGEPPSIESYEDFLHVNEIALREFYFSDREEYKLNIWQVIMRLVKVDKNMVKKIYIYSEYENKYIEEIVQDSFGGTMTSYVFGPFEEVVKQIPEDSTYVFSDMRKLHTLKKVGKLECASILAVDGYRYNYDENYIPVFDVEKEKKDTVFKFSYFNDLYHEY